MKKLFLFVLFAIVLPISSQAKTEIIKIYSDESDAFINTSPYPGRWSLQRYNTEGRFSNNNGIPSAGGDYARVFSGAFFTPTGYLTIERSFLSFDTSSIPDNALITEVKLSLFVNEVADQYNDQFSYIAVLEGMQESPTILNVDDVDKCGETIDNATLLSNKFDITNISPNTRLEIALNESGKSRVSLNGFTKLCLREGHDIDNQETLQNVYTGTWKSSFISFATTEVADLEKDPYIEITYEVPEEENEYPLYTQVESPYPSFSETAEWEDDSMPCGSIAVCGCTISSLVSGADYFGFETDVLSQSPTPATINSYLKSVGGYSSRGILSWLAASAYFGEFASDGTLATRLQYPPEFVSSNVSARIQSALDLENKIVLGFEELNTTTGEGHFVWIPAYADSSFIVRDPLWYETKTSDNEVTDSQIEKNYGNDFDEARIYTVLDEPESFSGTDIEVIVHGTAELLYQNVLGQKVGYRNGEILVDLERAVYGNITPVSANGHGSEFKGGKMLLLHEAGNEFTIDVVGTDFGEYEMEFFTISKTGEISTFSFSGQTIPEVTTTWSFNLETGEAIERPISYEQFLSILNIAMDGYTKQQRSFFLKWTEKMYASMEEKTVSQAFQTIEVYKKLLVAKKVEAPILSGTLNLLQQGLNKKGF